MIAPETRAGWELVAAAQAGDVAAFGELWLTYRHQVRRFIGSKVRDHHAVEDLTSETFLRAWRSIGGVRDQGRDVVSWLVRIAHNVVIDHARASTRSRVIPAADLDLVEEVADPGQGPEVSVPEQQNRLGTALRLDGYVAQLSDRERDCLRLRFTDELAAARAGASMGCTPSAVRTLQYRGLRRLAELIRADGYSSSAEFSAASPDPSACSVGAPGLQEVA